MSPSQDSGLFVARNDLSLILARTSGKGRSLVIEDLRETPLVEKATLEESIKSVRAEFAGEISAAIRLPELLRLANADEAKRFTTSGAVQKFARELPAFSSVQPGMFAVTSAKEGAGAPWLLAATANSAHENAVTALTEMGLKPTRTIAASLHTANALAASLKARGTDTAVLCLDLGALESHALVVTRRGVEFAATAPISLDAIAQAVQAELALKFKGSAAKLFFNEVYDFSEAGPKIAARLATPIKDSLAGLGTIPPVELYCAGLPAKQQWLAPLLAAEIGLHPYTPDVRAWCSNAGIAFGNATLEASISPAWLGFLHFVSSQSGGAPATAFTSEWTALDADIIPATPSAPVTTPTPAPPPTPVPPAKAPVVAAPNPAPASKAAPAPASPPPQKAAAVVSPAPARPLPTKPAPAPAPAAKAVPLAAKPPIATPAKPAQSVSYPPKPSTPPGKPTPGAKLVTPAPGNRPQPAPARVPAPVPTPSAVAYTSKPVKHIPVALILSIVVVLLLLGGGYLYVRTQNAKAERIAQAAELQAINERRAKTDAENARKAEELKARQDAEARRVFEAEVSQKLAAAEEARRQAELTAKQQIAAARLANARGSVVIATVPAGAMVTVGTLPARPSPATFSDLRTGKYPVSISLLHHDSAKFEVEISEDTTLEPPVVRLARITGSMEVTSDPIGANYDVRPANVLMVPPDARRTGKTPANFGDLVPGEYTVTLSREGWPPHTQNVTVNRNATAKVSWAFLNGTVQIGSNPSGAAVMRNGTRIGTTPMTLPDLLPGDVRYDLALPEHEPATVSGRVESGKMLTLAVNLLSFDRLASPAELDRRPEVLPQSQTQPDVPANIAQRGGRVEIELTVTPAGGVKDLRVVSSTNPALDRGCLAAANRLKFRPGTIDGKAMNVRMVVPYVFAPQ